MNLPIRPHGHDAGASLELRIGACAKTARCSRDVINVAMGSGELRYHRDAEGHRVATPDDLLSWMRSRGARHGK